MEGLVLILVLIIVIYLLDKKEKEPKEYTLTDRQRFINQSERLKEKDLRIYLKEKNYKKEIHKIVEKIDIHTEYITNEIFKYTGIKDKKETLPYLYCLSLEIISLDIVNNYYSSENIKPTLGEVKRKYKLRRLHEIKDKTSTYMTIDEMSKVSDEILKDIDRSIELKNEKSIRESAVRWLTLRLNFSNIEFDEVELTQKIDGTIKNFCDYLKKYIKTNISPEIHHSTH